MPGWPPEYTNRPCSGLMIGMSIGRTERTGPISAGIWEWNTATSRETSNSTIVSQTTSADSSPDWGRAALVFSILTAMAGRSATSAVATPVRGHTSGTTGSGGATRAASIVGVIVTGGGATTVPDRVALVVNTSGSTGEPRRVMLDAEALLASACATHERLAGGTGGVDHQGDPIWHGGGDVGRASIVRADRCQRGAGPVQRTAKHAGELRHDRRTCRSDRYRQEGALHIHSLGAPYSVEPKRRTRPVGRPGLARRSCTWLVRPRPSPARPDTGERRCADCVWWRRRSPSLPPRWSEHAARRRR